MKSLHTIVLALALSCAAHAQTKTANGVPISEASGRDLFLATCAGCHAADGKGNPQSIVGFDTPLPDFTDCKFTTAEPLGDWTAIVVNGGPIRGLDRKMPSFGDLLTTEQITKIVEHIRTLCTEKAWPYGELNLPRLMNTEKAFPENEAVLTTSMTRGPGSIGNQVSYEHRIGRRTQYEVVVPFTVQRNNALTGWNNGLGDIEVSLKHVLAASLKTGTIVSAGAEAAFSTGKEELGLGDGNTKLNPIFMLGQVLPHDSFFQFQGGVDHPVSHRSETNDEAFYRFGFGKTITQGWGRAWTPMIEALGTHALGTGEKTQWDLVPQFQVTLSKLQHIALGVGMQFPVNETRGRSKVFQVYFMWDWFDGGLRTGW